MSTSIKKTLKIVASDNYDKTNIFYFFILIFIGGMLGGLPNLVGSEKSTSLIPLIYLLYFVFSFLIQGIVIIATNNAIYRRKGVFPNPIEYIGKAFKYSFFTFIGYFVNTFMITLICGLIMGLLMQVNTMAAIFVTIPVCLFFTAFLIGAQFNFFTNLSFSDWFNYKKALEFMKKAGKYFCGYFFRSIAIYFLFSLIFLLVFIMVMIPFGAMTFLGPDSTQQSLPPLAYTIGMILGTIYAGLCSIYITELNAQFVRASLKQK